jgi:hypothetical protein
MSDEEKAPDARYDVAAWMDGALAWANRIEKSTIEPKRAVPSQIVPLARTDPRFVYALLVEFIAPRPNGLMTRLQEGAPLENPVWFHSAARTGARQHDIIGAASLRNDDAATGFLPSRLCSFASAFWSMLTRGSRVV